MSARKTVEKVPLLCEHCTAPFEVYPSRIAHCRSIGEKGPRFCSLGCYNAARRTVCTQCGEPTDRGGRKRLCKACTAGSLVAKARERSVQRRAECPPGLHWCRECDQFLTPEQYGPADKKGERICSPCQAVVRNRSHLRRVYGIEEDAYEALLAAQDGRCAICQLKPRKNRLAIDHDHKTGVIRGLLCMWCNHRLLGGARESVVILQAGIDYLTTPPAIAVIGQVVAPPAKKKPKRKRKAPALPRVPLPEKVTTP